MDIFNAFQQLYLYDTQSQGQSASQRLDDNSELWQEKAVHEIQLSSDFSLEYHLRSQRGR